MRRLMLGIVSSLALTCVASAQEAAAKPASAPAHAGQPAPAAPQRAAPAVAAAVPAAPPVVAANAASAQASYTEGQKIDLAGALYSTRDGRIVLKSDKGEIFVLLENQNLWRMEQRAAFGEREFRIRGQVSKYQERYYLSVAKILETGVKLEKKADVEESDKPFWERLMFWKNS